MKSNLDDWHVGRCECGHLTLRLGTLRVEFTKQEFADLHRLIGEAMREFDVEPSERTPVRAAQTRH